MKDTIESLQFLEEQFREAYEIYFDKHSGAIHGTKQRAYYKGKMNAFLDAIGALERCKEKFYESDDDKQ